MQSIGVDTNKLATRDTIESLAEKSGISVEQIKETGLNPNDKIGNSKNRIAQAYRGKGNWTPLTEEQKEELKKLGISLEKRDVTQEFIDKIKLLQSIGVDTNKLIRTDTIESLAEKSGISVKQIKEAGLNPEDKIGNSKSTITQAYRGKGTYTPPTKEQVEELRKLGISLNKKVARNKLKSVVVEQEKEHLLGENIEVKEEFGRIVEITENMKFSNKDEK